MPALGSVFTTNSRASLDLATAVEFAKAHAPRGSPSAMQLTDTRIQVVYEAAYLRVFVQWETLLEEATLRYMCGYVSPLYVPIFPAGQVRSTSLADAAIALFRGAPFVLWHDPQRNVARVAQKLDASPVETVSNTAQAWLESAANVRHRIAHGSADAKRKFDQATMNLAGRRFPGASPGRFLRSRAGNGRRWLEEITLGLQGLAAQIAP